MLRKALDQGYLTRQEMETLEGRLEHACQNIPLAQYFMNRIRHSFDRKKRYYERCYLDKQVLADFELWIDFLHQAYSVGTPMILLATTMPTHILWSDSCPGRSDGTPGGLGGYSLSGRAWRLQLPPRQQIKMVGFSNNFLEFLAAIINIWVLLDDNPDITEATLFALGDNGSTVGWLHKANFAPDTHAAHATAARKVATLLRRRQSTLAAEHIEGSRNDVSYLLSREHARCDSFLTSFIRSNQTAQVPSNFQIKPLSSEIISWVWSVLAFEPTTSLGEPTRQPTSTPASGHAGSISSNRGASQETHSCNRCPGPPRCVCSSPPPSFKPSANGNFQKLVATIFDRARSGKPLASWERSSGTVTHGTPSVSPHHPTVATGGSLPN